MRAHLLANGQLLDATLVAVLAYAGLRPGEALGLRWNDVGERTMLVERSVAFGELKSTKTGKARTVRLLAPLTESLATWRKSTTRSEPTDLVFPGPDGSPWSLDRVNNWRGHSFVSLLIAQGANVVDMAAQAGHSATMALSTYAHLFEEHRGGHAVSAEDTIRAAQRTHSVHEVSVLCPRPAHPSDPKSQNRWKQRVGDPGLEPGTSSLSGVGATRSVTSACARLLAEPGNHWRR
jgi:hypothetical protein